jgi:hypothetical protein
MKPTIRSLIGFALPAISALFISVAHAEVITGKLNGYDCAHSGITCPIDPQDPHVLLERDFVLQQKDGEYMFLTNIPRKTKLKHALKNIQVTGKRHAKFESIDVDEMRIKQGDKWKTVWSKSLQPKVKLESVVGRLNGHDCAHAGIACPVDAQDPRLLLERDFVLQQESGDYLFLTNIPRSTKLQYLLNDIKVTGNKDSKYNTIEVYELMIMRDDEWKSVWIRREQN